MLFLPAQAVSLCSVVRASKKGRIFIVLYHLWHGTSVYMASSKEMHRFISPWARGTKNVPRTYSVRISWITEFIIIDFLSGFANKSTVACRLMESLREFTFVTKDWANKPTFYSPSSLTGDSLYEWNFLNLDKQSVDQSLNRRSPALVLQYFDSGLPSFLYRCMFFIFIIMCTDALIYMWLKWVFA